jgi:hypothetical protein
MPSYNGIIAVGSDTHYENQIIELNDFDKTWVNTSGLTLFANGEPRGIAADKKGNWIIVGGDAPFPTIMRSSDGNEWHDARDVFGFQGRAVANGKVDGEDGFIAVGVDTGKHVKYSKDCGISWIDSHGEPFHISGWGNGVAWNGSCWVAVGNCGAAKKRENILYSENGISWNGSDSPFSVEGNAIAGHSNKGWVAVGEGYSAIKFTADINGSSGWSDCQNSLAVGYGIATNGSDESPVWIATGKGSSSMIVRSEDGVTWTDCSGGFSERGMSVFHAGGERWFVTGEDLSGNNILESTDNGITWSNVTCSSRIRVNAMASGLVNSQSLVRGTKIKTNRGYVPIEDLKIGDSVESTEAEFRSIKKITCRYCPPSKDSLPYIIPKGKHGAKEELYISPDHKILSAGVGFIEAQYLGYSQAEDWSGNIIYYNLGVGPYSDNTVLANGVAVQTMGRERPKKNPPMTDFTKEKIYREDVRNALICKLHEKFKIEVALLQSYPDSYLRHVLIRNNS